MKRLIVLMVLLLAACTDNDDDNDRDCINGAEMVENSPTSASNGVMPGTTFIKSWRIRNTGTCTWNSDYQIVKLRGDFIEAEPAISVTAPTPPGGELIITLTLRLSERAPMNVPQTAAFQLKAPRNNQLFGVVLQVQVLAGQPRPVSTPQPGATPVTVLTPVPPGSTQSGANCVNDALFLADVTVPDGSVVIPGQPFEKRWRYRNTGTCTWSSGYRMVQILGNTITMAGGAVNLPAAAPGQEVEISAVLTLSPQVPLGTSQSATFELRAPNNIGFGTQPYVEVLAGSAVSIGTPAACVNDAVFIADVTIPDGSAVNRGLPFVKTWRLQNTGTCPWNTNYTLVKILGDFFLAQNVPLPPVDAGQTADISVSLTLLPQAIPGQTYTATFELEAPNGDAFGVQPYVQVVAQ